MAASFVESLHQTFAAQSARPALIFQERIYSYAELDARARNFAAALQAQGVQPGDRVVLCTAAKLPFIVAHLGTLFAGAVSLPLNPRFTRDELRFFLSDSGAGLVVAGQDQRPIVEALRPELPELRTISADDAVLHSAGTFHQPALVPEDPCLIIYSSGTTGWPKGIVHTHANTAASLLALQSCWRFTSDDVVVNVLPLFHVHGLSFATQLTLMTGGCVIIDEFDARRTLDLVGRGTVFMSVPTIYYRFLEQSEFRASAKAWSNVRLFTCGSAPIRPEVLPDLESILNRPVINRYGMSEAFVITSLPLEGPWPQGSVGLPLPGIDVNVVREDGTSAEPGEVGSVLLCGPNLFREYWRQPDTTRAAFASGWFETGDLGQRDAAGFLTLVGRKNDLIITNGYNVYPQVVERILNSCPGVRESVVFGLPDPRRGEQVAAAVVRDDGTLDEPTVRGYLQDRLVDYQRPVTIRFVDSLPRNAMGKVLRRELRELVSASQVP
jgi:malonyl-CoA/methylmalonyl-CoA synthetase